MPRRIPNHQPAGRVTEQERHRQYQHDRPDQGRQAFYRSKEWRSLREVLLAKTPLCVACAAIGRTTAASVVDHIQELQDAPELALDPRNLRCVCAPCHNKKTAETVRDTTVIVTRGMPASGKTTWAVEFCAKDRRYRRICRDDLRAMYGLQFGEDEPLILQARNTLLRCTLDAGRRVVVDETTLQDGAYQEVIRIAAGASVSSRWFLTDPTTCRQRNAQRTVGRVPDFAIASMERAFIALSAWI